MMRDRILLAEDDAEMCEELFEILEGQRYLADVVHEGKSAIACLEKNRYALMLLDLKMPGISGYEVLKYARKFHPGVKILILSGSPLRPGQEDETQQIFPSGLDYEQLIGEQADGFINKPFDVETVLNKIKELLLS